MFYFDQLLGQAGITAKWDGATHTWALTDSSIDASSVSVAGGVGTGNTTITLNGVVIKKINTFAAKDPAAGKDASATTYFPAYYINNVFAAVGIQASWNGSTGLAVSTAPVALAVKSVSVVNSRQLQVQFTQPVSSTNNWSSDVTVTAQGSAVAPSGVQYDLSTDGKTLTITSTNATLSQNGYYAVTVSGVQDSNLNTITPYSGVVEATDNTAPTVVSTKAVTNQASTQSFTLNLSEPATFDLIKVNGVVASAVPTDATDTSYTVTVPASNLTLDANQNYSVAISGLRDFDGNYAASTVNTSVTVLQDTTKPTYTITPVSPTEFKVTFSKEMNTSVPVDGITVTNASGATLPLAGLPSFESDDQTLDVNLASSPIASGDTSATVNVDVANFSDSIGNVVAEKTQSVTLSKSSTLPVITAARQVPGSYNQIQVTLNEKVALSGSPASDFYVTDSKGNTYAVSTVGTEDSNNNIILTLGSALPQSGTYTVALGVGTATDGSGNTNQATSTSFNYTAASAAQLTAAVESQYDTTNTDVTNSTTHQAFVVQFNQQSLVNGINPTTGGYYAGAADNPANYSIDGAALPTGATVKYYAGSGSSNDYVVIDLSGVSSSNLPSEFKNGGTSVVTVSNVQDKAGSTVQYTSGTVTVADTTAPTITGAYLTGDSTDGYTLTLDASEALSASKFTAGDFAVSVNGGSPLTADDATLSADGKTVTLKFTSSANETAISGNTNTLTVSISGATSTDLNGNAFADTTTPIAVTDYASN